MGVITFNGVESSLFNIEVEHPPDYVTPERDYDVTHVPGRNGDVYIDKGSYQNVPREYEIVRGSLTDDFTEMANDIIEWLHSASGYAVLSDSYEPDYYRLAAYKDSVSLENLYGQAARTTISFDCKPQRFLVTGDTATTFTSSGTIYNETNFTALPIITVYGSGSGVLVVGSYTVTISSIDSYIVIDSEIQDAYKGTSNQNSYVTLSNGFPKLASGYTSISFSGDITSVEVVPKWWTL